jgi:hypothetical protein
MLLHAFRDEISNVSVHKSYERKCDEDFAEATSVLDIFNAYLVRRIVSSARSRLDSGSGPCNPQPAYYVFLNELRTLQYIHEGRVPTTSCDSRYTGSGAT